MIGGTLLLLRSCVNEIDINELEEGDVLLPNDPYRGGLHTPEHTFFKPVFVDGKAIGFAVAIGHICEVGGMVPAGFAGQATEVFHEGLRVPPEGQASWQGRRQRVASTARECSHPALQFG